MPKHTKLSKRGQAKMHRVMREFYEGKLHSGSKNGPIVRSAQRAKAIGMSEAKKAERGGYRKKK